jgi:hypothetical protein
LPRVDQGLSALLDDLEARGLLEETLIVWFGDFGRTPKVNPTAGRDHWSTAGVALLAGGGLRVGQVVGATNPLGEYVIDHPVTSAGPGSHHLHGLGNQPAHLVPHPRRTTHRTVPGRQTDPANPLTRQSPFPRRAWGGTFVSWPPGMSPVFLSVRRCAFGETMYVPGQAAAAGRRAGACAAT